MAQTELATKVVVVILARGGSRGIPRKNLVRVLGRSLLERSVTAARSATTVDRVFVSTEDSEIDAEARRCGASTIRRPTELATDGSSSESALLHALDVVAEEGHTPEVLVLVQCTSPFLAPTDIDRAVRAVQEGADSSFSASRFHGFTWQTTESGTQGVNHDPSVRLRRQDREPEYLENGAVYAMDVAGFRRHRHRFFGSTRLVEMPTIRSLEVDEPEDLEIARLLAPIADSVQPHPGVLAHPRGIAFDFDGVLTDDLVTTSADGDEFVVASRSDGMGIALLQSKLGVPMVVLSSETHPVGEARCRKLGLDHRFGLGDKLHAFIAWCDEHGIQPNEAIFVGNDVNDVGCLRASGCAVTPADAHPAARSEADLVLQRSGGRGAIRELADLVLHRIETGEAT